MADLATPSAATISTIDAGSEPVQKGQKTKPEKPDDQKYKESLGKAQKEHAAAQERVVRLSNPARTFKLYYVPTDSQHVGCRQGQDRSRPTSK